MIRSVLVAVDGSEPGEVSDGMWDRKYVSVRTPSGSGSVGPMVLPHGFGNWPAVNCGPTASSAEVPITEQRALTSQAEKPATDAEGEAASVSGANLGIC